VCEVHGSKECHVIFRYETPRRIGRVDGDLEGISVVVYFGLLLGDLYGLEANACLVSTASANQEQRRDGLSNRSRLQHK
jgi:hypothetical protein